MKAVLICHLTSFVLRIIELDNSKYNWRDRVILKLCATGWNGHQWSQPQE